jgi:hypothetical protein
MTEAFRAAQGDDPVLGHRDGDTERPRSTKKNDRNDADPSPPSPAPAIHPEPSHVSMKEAFAGLEENSARLYRAELKRAAARRQAP